MTEGEVILRRAAGESRKQNRWGQQKAWLESAGLLLDFLMSSPKWGHWQSCRGGGLNLGKKMSCIFLGRKSTALCSEGKLQFLSSYFMFFSVLRACTVYSVEQVPCGSCRTGWRDLLAGEMGSDNLFPSADAIRCCWREYCWSSQHQLRIQPVMFSQEAWTCDGCARREPSPVLPSVCVFVRSVQSERKKSKHMNPFTK